MQRFGGGSRILVSLTPASWLTLGGGLLSSAAVFVFLDVASVRGREHWFALGAALMFGGLSCDALDGLLARRFHWESELGKLLDSLCDAVSYLIAPAVGLRALGARGLLPTLALLAMIAAGLLRLAYFSMIGNVQTDKGPAYLGLPSFYSHFAFVVLVFVHARLVGVFEAAVVVILLPMSALFVSRVTFPKPKNPFVMFSIIGALILGALMVFALDIPV